MEGGMRREPLARVSPPPPVRGERRGYAQRASCSGSAPAFPLSVGWISCCPYPPPHHNTNSTRHCDQLLRKHHRLEDQGLIEIQTDQESLHGRCRTGFRGRTQTPHTRPRGLDNPGIARSNNSAPQIAVQGEMDFDIMATLTSQNFTCPRNRTTQGRSFNSTQN